MSGEIERQPVEIRKTGEETENTEQQKLDDATLEPLAAVEQSGDFRQAEILQEAFTGIVENAGEMTTPEIQMVEGRLIPVSSGEEVPAITMPGQRATKGDGQPPPPPPDQIVMEPVTGAGSESEEQAPGILMDASVFPFMPESQGSEEGSPVQPASVLEAGALIMEEGTGPDMFEGQLVEGQVVILEEALGEAEEGWIPITGMYVHVGQDGTKTVVDADGNPVDSPPLYTMIVNEKGEEIFLARYPTSVGETEIKGILTTYSAPITGMFVHVAQDGITVVDANGEPVDSPPLIRKLVDPKGDIIYDAYYPSGERAALTAYSAPITGMFVHGNTVVDGNGKPVDSPPTIVKVANDQGGVDYLASYPSGEHAVLTAYSAPITGMFVHGNTVVDANGKPVDSPPTIVKVANDQGGVDYLASYPSGEHAVLSAYSAPITGMFVHVGQDGERTVVDANGKPVDSPPTYTIILNAKGEEVYLASYPGGDATASKAALTAYSAPITGMFVHVGQDGTPTVVDADGKPVDSPPLTRKIVDGKGNVIYDAYYPGGQGTPLDYYKPPSA